jgi:hypothetical protein
MSDEQTAREQLDEAIKRFSREANDREGMVTGWVVVIGTARFDDEGDTIYGYDYGVGPDTDLQRAVGLFELGRRRMYEHVSGGGMA